MKENSIEEDIKIALDKFSDNKDSNSAVLIVEQFILGNYVLVGGRKNIVKNSLRYILSDYKRVLKENAKLKNKLLDTLEGQKVIKEETPQYIKENYIPKQKVKDKIEEEKLPLTIVGGRKNKKTLEYGIKLGRRQALQELIEESEEK